jgi:hypothetical protein
VTRESIKAYWTEKGNAPRWQLFGVYLFVVAAFAIGLLQISSVANRADTNSNNTSKLADDTARLARENSKLATQIQQQRTTSIFDGCNDQNDRHDTAVKVTLRLLGHPPVPPDRKLTDEQLRAQRKALLEWMQALVPKRDCQNVLQEATTP